MKTEDNFLEYDDQAAVSYIQHYLTTQCNTQIPEDTIYYVLDTVYDFYEKKGFLSDDAALEASIDEEEMFDYLIDASKKDNIDITEESLQLILDGEYAYGKSLGIYSEE